MSGLASGARRIALYSALKIIESDWGCRALSIDRRSRMLREVIAAVSPGARCPGQMRSKWSPQGGRSGFVVERTQSKTHAEVVVALTPSAGVATHIRSTLLTSSLQALRERGLQQRHAELLPAEHRRSIQECIAGQWLPLEVGLAHYRACDALALSSAEHDQIGRTVSRQIHATLLGLTLKVARATGLTPWTLLRKTNTLYSRLFRGGGTQVIRAGERSALIEVVGLPLLDIPYFRNAVCGNFAAGIELLATDVRIRLRRLDGPSYGARTSLHAEWS